MKDESKRKVLGNNLKMQIEKTGLERLQFCNLTGIKPTTLCEWINGQRYPRVESLYLMAEFFGCRVSALTEEQTPKEMRARELIELFDSLGEEEQNSIVDFARFKFQEAKAKKEEK